MEIGDSDDEIGGSGRMLGRIAKTHGRYKQKASFSQEEEEEDTNSKESDKILGDGQEKGKDETNKEVEKWDDTVDGTWDFEAEIPTKDPSQDPTHIFSTITMPSVDNQDNTNSDKVSPKTISSHIRKDELEIFRAPTNNLDVQDKRNSLVNCNRALNLGVSEDGVITHKDLQKMKDKCIALEEGFTLFSKFTLKMTHVVATTLRLLDHELEEEGMGKEDSKLLYKFLAEDQAKVLLVGKGKKKDASQWPPIALCFLVLCWTFSPSYGDAGASQAAL